MRIISQDGKTDLPYDSIALFVNDNFIMAEALNRERLYVMAEYDSEETAIDAINHMRNEIQLIKNELDDGAIVIYPRRAGVEYYHL